MPDYMYMLESRLSAEQRATMMRVQELALETGTNLYLTGGAVRDLISGMSIRGLDFTVEGNPSRMTRELEKGGAKIVSEDEKLRSIEILFSGNVEGGISAAREEIYSRPGAKPEIRWSTIMEDLRRRDFSINAIALSLNAGSRGLLLDPTNGLADLETREVRALSMHTFTNQPVRLLRAIRYSVRMDFKIESRTEEWFALALERKLPETISPEDAGRELRQLAREDKPALILKAWEARGLIGTIHPQLDRRHIDYELLTRILRARDDLASAGLHARLFAPVILSVLGKLKDRERSPALHRLGFSARETEEVMAFEDQAQSAAKALTGSKMASAADAFAFLEKTPPEVIAWIMAENSSSKAVGAIRNYLNKWRPLRQALPAAALELESLGHPRGPKFDKVIQDFFQAQLAGKARLPEDRIKLLRKLSGIKEAPVKKEEKKKGAPDKGEKGAERLKGRLGAKPEPQPSAGAAPATKSAKHSAAGHPTAFAPAQHGVSDRGHAHAAPEHGKSEHGQIEHGKAEPGKNETGKNELGKKLSASPAPAVKHAASAAKRSAPSPKHSAAAAKHPADAPKKVAARRKT